MVGVIDTNVPAVANATDSEFPACVAACVRHLTSFLACGRLVLDDGWRILREYMGNLHSSGQPGVGDAFLKWALTNQFNPQRCCLVRITPRDGCPTDFAEFPTDPRLRSFDPSDRKFIAVAVAHPERPPVHQALDRKWWQHRSALRDNGVDVNFLCPDAIEQLDERKRGPQRAR